MIFTDTTQRFSNRVADYARYRPSYPSGVVQLLREECSLRPEHVIADIGSGTGLLSKLFLDHGNRVFGVEPNPEMRTSGEEFLRGNTNFTSINGSAEATTLAGASVNFVTAGQAFHWFDTVAARREFQRILKPEGCVIVLWNERLLDDTAFLRDYEALLRRFGTDYARVHGGYPRPDQMLAFFAANEFTSHSLPNFQDFDFRGLSGRLRSSSYVPPPGHPNYTPMMEELQRIFSAHQEDGVVHMEYRTRIYAGQLVN